MFDMPRIRPPKEQEEWERNNAANLKIPHLPQDTVFNPSGLVPFPCDHGIETKPARYPVTKGGGFAHLNDAGEEYPPFIGLSWGRSKYLTITAFGGRSGIPYAIASCIVCTTGIYPDDFFTAADGTPLR